MYSTFVALIGLTCVISAMCAPMQLDRQMLTTYDNKYMTLTVNSSFPAQGTDVVLTCDSYVLDVAFVKKDVPPCNGSSYRALGCSIYEEYVLIQSHVEGIEKYRIELDDYVVYIYDPVRGRIVPINGRRYLAKLTILNLTKSDEGYYRCMNGKYELIAVSSVTTYLRVNSTTAG